MTEPVHKLGDVLRTAREAKGVDLSRVERDTKIRQRYLAALESGDYRDLPGAVYTRGFLRNYGAYLGLDAEELIDLYRLETSVTTSGVDRQALPTPPKPLATRRARAFVVTPNAIVAAILTIMVGGFFAYLGYQFINFARTPDLRITDPPSNVAGYTQLEITIRGETEPNATITVDNLPENPTVVADAEGHFEVTLDLLPGSNVIELTADDPVTGRRSETESRTIVVETARVSPSPEVPATVEITSPAANAVVTGPVTVGGQSTPGAALSVAAELDRPPTPAFAIADAAGGRITPAVVPPAPPAPVSVEADASGAFTTSIALPPGAWTLTVATDGAEARTRVAVAQGSGVAATVTIEGGESYLDMYEDGARVPEVSGRNAQDGDAVELSATREIRIRAGNAAAVRVRINGIDVGAMGGQGSVVEWVITRAGG